MLVYVVTADWFALQLARNAYLALRQCAQSIVANGFDTGSEHLLLPLVTKSIRHSLDTQNPSHAHPARHIVTIASEYRIWQQALKQVLDGYGVDLACCDVLGLQQSVVVLWMYQHPKICSSPHISSISPVADAIWNRRLSTMLLDLLQVGR